MSSAAMTLLESFRRQPLQETSLPKIHQALVKQLMRETPSPDLYLALFERLEREAELTREDTRKRAHARARKLAKQQGVKPIKNMEDLKGDFWPEEESADDFLSWVRVLRKNDKSRSIPE